VVFSSIYGKMQYSEGLKKNKDFSHVYNGRYSRSSGPLYMYVRENGMNMNRIGVVVSKKVGNSVVRHRIKRMVKENYRLDEISYKKGYDMVVVAKKSAATADFYDIKKSMAELCKACHLLNTENEDH
jgi:ribonuclease P protein component